MDKSIYLDEETYDKLVMLAEKNHRNIVSQVRHMVEESQ